MNIKDYKCKCGHNDFFFVDKGNQKGIYCSYCGKWLKWADKDEQNLSMKQDPKTGHWISLGVQGEVDGQIVQAFTCSECGAISIFRMASGNIVNGDICPNCGARMESEVDNG